MTELMLLSPGAGGWRAFPLLPIQQADAVIWGASVVQYSADAGSPTAIPGPDEWPELGHRSAILASVGAVTCGDAVAWCFV